MTTTNRPSTFAGIRSMSDLDIAFSEAVLKAEQHNDEADLIALEQEFPTLITVETYRLKVAQLREEGEL